MPYIGCPKQTFSFWEKQSYIAKLLGQIKIADVTCLSEILFYQWHLKCENSCSIVIQVINVADNGVAMNGVQVQYVDTRGLSVKTLHMDLDVG